MNKNKKIIIEILIALFIIIIGAVTTYILIENNITNRANFNFTIENSSSNTVQTVNHKQSEYSFFGKVVESHTSYIIVEPNKDEEERKSADKIYIALGQYNDTLYIVGTNIKVTYDGTIQETFPAQIHATKIELKSADNFEILFYDKQHLGNYEIYTISDKSETTKYDYTIYGYGGSVNIRIDGKDYSLKEALSQNKITMEEIIEKANQDEKNGIIKSDMYKDGGSMQYNYENYTIIKCHTIDGNRDVYIGTKDLKLNDII